MEAILKAKNIHAWFGKVHAVRDVTLEAHTHTVTAMIGPSGCGKSTFLRTLNRLHEEVPGARVQGQVILGGENIYDSDVDPVAIRRRIGMVFQKANPFPAFSIFDNVAAGLKLAGMGR